MIEIIVLSLLIGILITLYRVGKTLDNFENRIKYIESIDGEDIKKLIGENYE
tara:strand:+ start:711 stop:866 length:156 start_codon:yes stop_codon:yes gene_type:complete